jgi:hypothetical protein
LSPIHTCCGTISSGGIAGDDGGVGGIGSPTIGILSFVSAAHLTKHTP